MTLAPFTDVLCRPAGRLRLWIAILGCALFFTGRAAAQVSSDDFTGTWKYLTSTLGDYLMPLTLEHIPKEEYNNLKNLAEQVRLGFGGEPTEEELSAYLQKHHGGAASEEVISDAKIVIQRTKFLETREPMVKKALKGSRTAMLRKTVGADVGRTGIVLICIPFPSPGPDWQKQALEFIDRAAKRVREKNGKLYLIRTLYGKRESLKVVKEDPVWAEDIRNLPERYGSYIQAGTVKILDSLAGYTYTPYGYLFRDGELVKSGNLLEWFRDDSIWDEFK